MQLASPPPAQGPCFTGQTLKKGLPVSHRPCLAHPQTANARGKVAENATLPLRQPAAAVRQAPFLPLLRRVTSHNNTWQICLLTPI
ncbi:MAG TPA: hypothetical protein PK228_05820 [Saprospiraceae bacterium]|nr:hypothetical protein [Saprospiraceae bacterium]